jgi:hypothetical protein
MGYVETGRWKTYSNGAWEFRATYVCIELRLRSYPFQKFRMTPRRFGVKPKNNTKNGTLFEPWVLFRKHRIYFEIWKTKKKVARIHDVAKYWLKVKGGDRLNFGEKIIIISILFKSFMHNNHTMNMKKTKKSRGWFSSMQNDS